MIRSIRHKGLKRLYESDGLSAGVELPRHGMKLRDILVRLDTACSVFDMDLPGFAVASAEG